MDRSESDAQSGSESESRSSDLKNKAPLQRQKRSAAVEKSQKQIRNKKGKHKKTNDSLDSQSNLDENEAVVVARKFTGVHQGVLQFMLANGSVSRSELQKCVSQLNKEVIPDDKRDIDTINKDINENLEFAHIRIRTGKHEANGMQIYTITTSIPLHDPNEVIKYSSLGKTGIDILKFTVETLLRDEYDGQITIKELNDLIHDAPIARSRELRRNISSILDQLIQTQYLGLLQSNTIYLGPKSLADFEGSMPLLVDSSWRCNYCKQMCYLGYRCYQLAHKKAIDHACNIKVHAFCSFKARANRPKKCSECHAEWFEAPMERDRQIRHSNETNECNSADEDVDDAKPQDAQDINKDDDDLASETLDDAQ